jgi:hypothetical protein
VQIRVADLGKERISDANDKLDNDMTKTQDLGETPTFLNGERWGTVDRKETREQAVAYGMADADQWIKAFLKNHYTNNGSAKEHIQS